MIWFDWDVMMNSAMKEERLMRAVSSYHIPSRKLINFRVYQKHSDLKHQRNMKVLRFITCAAIAVALMIGCDEGIDPISHVPPGDDVAPPTVSVSYPVEGTLIRVKEDVAPINIQFQAEDDIEISVITLSIDGTKIGEVSGFKDYRR